MITYIHKTELVLLYWKANMIKAFRSIAAILLALPALVQAQGNQPTIQLTDPTGTGTFAALAEKIVSYLWQIAIPIIAIMVLWGGFLFLTAGDDISKVQKAKNTLKWAVIGTAVILVAQGVVFIIGELFGVENINQFMN